MVRKIKNIKIYNLICQEKVDKLRFPISKNRNMKIMSISKYN